ncbi:xaa-Arg dipeptidase-like [Amblyomma americanum]
MDAQEVVDKAVARSADSLHAVGRFLWENPETCFEEHKAHDVICTFLEGEGFQVKRHYALETAFRAEYGVGPSPVVALLCEYDALPGLGHACGHNLIAESALTAAVAARELMKAYSRSCGTQLQGKLVVLGTPAEEGGMGKEHLLRAGCLDDVDAALMAHPERRNVLRIVMSARSGISAVFESADLQDRGEQSSALDAAVLAYCNISLLRARLNQECKMHGILLRSEEVPNAEVCRSHLHFCVRSRTSQMLQKVQRDVEACMEAAAKATGCAVKISEKGILSKHMHLNEPLLKVFQRRAEEQGMSFLDAMDCRPMTTGATSDVGNVSHRLPTIHPLFRIESTAMNHTAEYSRVAGMRQSQERALVVGKALALTALDLLRDQSILDAAWEHFERTRKELRD